MNPDLASDPFAITQPDELPRVAEAAQAVWVLLRGMSRESGHWSDFPARLSAELSDLQPGAQLLMLDLPGNGVLHGQSSPMQVAAILESCRAELRTRGVSGPIHLLGMSLGAMVLTEWANRYPHEVLGGVLINASLRPFSRVFRRAGPLSYLRLLLLSLSRVSARKRELALLQMTTRITPAEAVLDRWVQLQRERPLGVRNTVRQMVASVRYRASRVRPGSPMLLLCSKADSLVDWRCSQAISRAWGAPLRLHTRAGHDLPLDDPVWVARAIADWLRDRSRHGVSPGEWH